MAPNGFVQRWKGKVALPVGGLFIGGVSVTPSAADLNTVLAAGTLTAYTTAGTQNIAAGNATISASSALSIFSMLEAPKVSVERVLSLILVSSGVFIKAAAGTSFDPSTNTVIKSTYAQQITLFGLSTTKWSIKSVFPVSTIGGTLTLSTTT